MALPMVSALRAADAGTRITWMCGKEVAPLIGCIEGIAESIVVDEVAILTGSRLAKTGAVAAAWSRLAGKAFDAIYVAHSDPRYLMLASPGFYLLAALTPELLARRGFSREPGRLRTLSRALLAFEHDVFQAAVAQPIRLGTPWRAALAASLDDAPLLADVSPGAHDLFYCPELA